MTLTQCSLTNNFGGVAILLLDFVLQEGLSRPEWRKRVYPEEDCIFYRPCKSICWYTSRSILSSYTISSRSTYFSFCITEDKPERNMFNRFWTVKIMSLFPPNKTCWPLQRDHQLVLGDLLPFPDGSRDI